MVEAGSFDRFKSGPFVIVGTGGVRRKFCGVIVGVHILDVGESNGAVFVGIGVGEVRGKCVKRFVFCTLGTGVVG